MPGLITAESFTPSDFKGLNLRKDVQDLVAVALSLGWTGQRSQRGLTLRAPADNVPPIHLSKTPRSNSGPLQQWRTKIFKYGDPLKIAMMDGAQGAGVELTDYVYKDSTTFDIPDTNIGEWMSKQAPSFVIALRSFDPQDIFLALRSARIQGEEPPTPDRAIEIIREYVEAKKAVKEEKEEPKEMSKSASAVAAPKPTPPPGTRAVVSIKPYMAKSHRGSGNRPGRVYESKSVLERKWSDGSVDYMCNLCPQTSDTVIGVNSHRKKHTNAGEVPVIGNALKAGLSTLVEDPTYVGEPYPSTRSVQQEPDVEPEYNPREDRVAALAADLLQAMEGHHGETPAEIADRLARRALGWVHAQQGIGTPHGPKTAEEVLEAIRSLVDRGEYFRLRKEVEAAEQAIAEARRATEEAQQNAERSQRRAEKLKSDLFSLRDLMNSVGSDDDDTDKG